MLYKVTFLVSRDDSGYATYMANCAGGFSPPYQKPKSNNMCEQFFYFKSVNEVNMFLSQAFKEFGTYKFILESVVMERKGKEK